jgi:hypothetical protein
MKMTIAATVLLLAPSAAVLEAADAQLLGLVMPNAKVLAGVNVSQAAASPFGRYMVAQIEAHDAHLQQMIAKTGFDPTRDLHEVLTASTGAANAPSLTVARGTFDISRITAAAQSSGGTTQTYKGVTIVTDPKDSDCFAFLNPTLALAGHLADVKGAIDRQNVPTVLPSTLQVMVNQLSTTEDAWGVSEVPPPSGVMISPPGAPAVPPNAFQNIEQASGGVKFGAQIVATAKLQADTAQNANSLANVLQFLLNLGQMQSQKDAQVAAVLKDVVVSVSGNTVNVSASVPEATAEAAVQLKAKAKVAKPEGQPQENRL